MNKMNVIIIGLCICIVLAAAFMPTNEVIKEDREVVQVTIVDSYYRAPWMQTILIDKSIYTISHPALYQITVEYNGKEYSFDDLLLYRKYENMVGCKISAVLVTKHYEDGTKKLKIEIL